MAYSEFEQAEALVALALNRYDYEKTSAELGISVKTLRRWDKCAPKKGVFELLERAIEQLLMRIPEKMSGEEWGIALGILLDKWLLLQGQPTARTESIAKQISQLTDDEYRAAIAEAERILAESTGGSLPAGQPEEPEGTG